jgi:hypothetical protein
MVTSRSRTRGERGVNARHDATLQRWPARIRRGIPAKRDQRVAHLQRRNRTIRRLGVDLVTAAHRQAINFIVPVKLPRPRRGATPTSHAARDHRSAGRVDGNNMRAENSGHGRWGGGQGNGIGRNDVSLDRADIESIVGVTVENAQPVRSSSAKGASGTCEDVSASRPD